MVHYLALLQGGRIGEVKTLANTKAYVDVDAVGWRRVEMRQPEPVVCVKHVDVTHSVDSQHFARR